MTSKSLVKRFITINITVILQPMIGNYICKGQLKYLTRKLISKDWYILPFLGDLFMMAAKREETYKRAMVGFCSGWLTITTTRPGGVRLRVLSDGRYLVFDGNFLRCRTSSRVQVGEEATRVHLRREWESHGVGWDHGWRHTGYPGILTTHLIMRVSPGSNLYLR